MPNQYKPVPPLSTLEEPIRKYYEMGLNDKEILRHLHDRHIDQELYGLGRARFKTIRKSLGLLSTRQQAHTLTTAAPTLFLVRTMFPKAGLRDMALYAFREHGVRVSRKVLQQFFKTYEPHGILERKAKRLKRKRFWAAGVNDIWCVDQHDKWKRFGLCLHTGIEPVSGKVLWLKVWWTNSNPRLIFRYYADTAEELGFIPLVTQSDPGTENFGIANGHTTLRHMHDPSLEGTRQHRFMRKHQNIKPEISWRVLRTRFTPGFESLLEEGVHKGWYDPNDPLDILVFRWIVIPWMQAELDAWKDTHNVAAKRADRNKILPHGRPDLIFEAPHMFDTMDFKVRVDPAALDEVKMRYCPADHPVFELVPPAFDTLAHHLYSQAGSPEINRQTVWKVYGDLLVQVRQAHALDESAELEAACNLVATEAAPERADQDDMPLSEGLRELRNGDAIVGTEGFFYMGGVDKGYAAPGETIQDLDIGGGMELGGLGLQRNPANYPANFDLEDEAEGEEIADAAMVFADFSDEEPEGPADEW